MANFGRVKTWGNETLTAADLNAEFDNIINNVTSGSVSSANIDLTDGYAWTGAHTFSVDLKVLNGAGVIVGNTSQVTTSSAGEFQVLGTAAADSTAIIGHWAAAATGGKVSFVKSRTATIGSSTIVQDNDLLGTIEFIADDGSDFATPAASIFSRVNGTPGANDMPGELVLAVTADAGNDVTERVRVLQNGTVELNSATLSFDAAASIDTSGNNNLGLSAGTADVQITASNVTPASNDGSALGVSGTAWSDLFLASGAVANWNAGDITLTHSAGKLTFGGDGAVEIDFNDHEMTNVDINSGAIDGTIIGAASAAAGSFAAIVGTSLDVNGAADISGDLTLSAGADGALTFANAGENSIKIPDNQASALIVEEADNAYMTFVSTNSGEKVTISQDLDFDSGTIDMSTQTVDITLNGAADALNFDSNTLSIDASNNRVGIGTAGPQAPLEIAGSSQGAVLALLQLTNDPGSSTDAGTGVSLDFAPHHNAGTVASMMAINEDGGAGTGIGFKTHNGGATGERVRIDHDGNLRPGADNSYDLGTSSYRFDDIYATNGTIDTSDLTRKMDIVDTDLGLAFVENLRPVSYKFKDYIEQRAAEDANGNATTIDVEHQYTRRHYGLIAQEIEAVLAGKDCAALVKTPKEGGGHYYGLRYTELLAPIIKAVQEISAKVRTLEAA